ncbi:hypothetical protein NHH03_04175 [Stieleria sp. TO1_6]|uniref:hypothetical protein n=1 Tax=Stieleria tagensis TaxID=2956795 RepID=UPI00209B802E|nr:hypothetical protein [Stieleria tagensis]MCO8120923.1 hypothetical protein [Stieleria tagensis]
MRLPVILVQNPPAAGAALAEALVGYLIGRAGLDLTLVDRFDAISADSTDRLTLDGISVPSAILDWRSADDMLSVLSGIEFHGVRAPHQLDPDHEGGRTAGSGVRRLFLFDLTRHTDAAKITAELVRLKDSLAVKTVSLGGLTPPRSPQPQRTKPVPTPTPLVSPVGSTPAVSDAQAKPPTAVGTRSDQNLDDLINRLDELDV